MNASQPSPRPDPHARLTRLKRQVVAGAVVAFAALWGLAAGHIVGVTAAGQAAASGATPAPTAANPFGGQAGSSGFFNSGAAANPGLSGGGFQQPVVQSGGS